MSNKQTKNSNKNSRKSMKGKWGNVGAPPKTVKWPSRLFTMATLFARNPNQCQLSLRNKVNDAIDAGTIIQLASKKQPGGSVGRPMSVFVMKEHFDSSTMTRHVDQKPATTRHNKRTKKIVVATVTSTTPVAPATAPPVTPSVVVASSVSDADAVPASPAPAPVAVPVSPVFSEPTVVG